MSRDEKIRIGCRAAAVSAGLAYMFPAVFDPEEKIRLLITGIIVMILTRFLSGPVFTASGKDRKAVCFLCAGIISAAAMLGELCESDTLFGLRHLRGVLSAVMYLWSRTVFGGSLIFFLFRHSGLIPILLCGVLLIPSLAALGIFLAAARSVILMICLAVYLCLLLAGLKEYCRRFVTGNADHLAVFTALLLFFCWLPWLIVHFPVYGGGGAPHQIQMFLGRYTQAGRSLTHLVYDGSFISNHHPILLTLLYGSFIKAGLSLHTENLFAFLLSLFNLLTGVCCFGFSLGRIRRYVSAKVFFCTVLICCFYPLFGAYGSAVCKDNLFSDVLLVFYTLLFELIAGEKDSRTSFRDKWLLCAASLLLPFLKNQGAIVVFLSLLLPSVYYAVRRKTVRGLPRRLLLTGLCALGLYYGLYSRVLMPLFRINPGGRQEALSVPFQQTALFFKEHRDLVTAEEEALTDKILPVNDIDYMYRPRRADKVKFMYKQDASPADLADYFRKVWLPQFRKAPAVYLRAWVLLTDDYFMFGSPELEFDIYPTLTDEEFGIRRPQWVQHLAAAENEMLVKIKQRPFIAFSMHCALFFVIMMLSGARCVYGDRKKYLIALFPVFVNFLVLLMCPWNGVVRYALPLVYALPVEMILLTAGMTERSAEGDLLRSGLPAE